MSGRCLEGVWRVSGGYLGNVWGVFGGRCLDGVLEGCLGGVLEGCLRGVWGCLGRCLGGGLGGVLSSVWGLSGVCLGGLLEVSGEVSRGCLEGVCERLEGTCGVSGGGWEVSRRYLGGV